MRFSTDIHDPQRMNPTDFVDLLTFPPFHKCGFTEILESVAMNFGIDSHVSLRMNPDNFLDVTFAGTCELRIKLVM